MEREMETEKLIGTLIGIGMVTFAIIFAFGIHQERTEQIVAPLTSEKNLAHSCYEGCINRGFEFVKFFDSPTIIAPDECWCSDGNKPERIW